MTTPTLLSNRDEFQAWKESPQTKEFLTFLRDRQSDLTAGWGRGLPMTPEQQGQAVLLGQLAECRWSDFAAQYELKGDDDDQQ